MNSHDAGSDNRTVYYSSVLNHINMGNQVQYSASIFGQITMLGSEIKALIHTNSISDYNILLLICQWLMYIAKAEL